MKICFTGHRKIAAAPGLKNKLFDFLNKLVVNGAVDFYTGGAIGWDTIAAQTILHLREVYPHIKLHLILPCSNEEQTVRWTETQKIEFYRILNLADSVEYTSQCYHKECMKIRNARLIELSDYCICYYDGKFRSGTAQTVRMAQKKHIMIVNFYNT